MKALAICSLVLISCAGFAQDDQPSSSGSFGLGIGIDYGGFGGRITYLPAPKFGLLAGIGYNLVGLGFNGGAILRISPGKKMCPYLGALYGYNGVIVVEGASQYNKEYYGPSATFGLEIRARDKKFFNVELVLPFRPQAFTDDWNAIKNNPAFAVQNDPLPIAFSIGYHWGF